MRNTVQALGAAEKLPLLVALLEHNGTGDDRIGRRRLAHVS
jgi:hypothetical protein